MSSETTHAQRIAEGASVVAGATLLSRGLGFVRDLVTAYALGAGPVADAFFVAFRLPNLMRRLFGEGSLTMAFVPVFARIRAEEGDASAFAMARAALVWLAAILSVICVAAVVFAEPLTFLIAPGFARDPEIFALTVSLVRICFPFALFICAVALCMGVLNAMDHYLGPSLAPCVMNVVLIAAAFGAVWTGGDVAHTLAWALLLSGWLQWELQQPFLRRKGFSWRGPVTLAHHGIKRLGRVMLPTVFGAAVYQVNILIGTLLASYLPTGSVSYLYYADRLVQFPLGVFGVAVSTAALPSLSRLAAAQDDDGFASALASALRLTLFISLPAAAGLIALSHPVVALLFKRGAFSADAVRATSWALVAYSAGLPAFAVVRPLVSAFYARQDTRTPVYVGAACLVIYVGCALALMGPLAHVGLALAVTVASWANAVILAVLVRRGGVAASLDVWRGCVWPGLAHAGFAVGVGLAAWGTWAVLDQRGLGNVAVALIPVWAVGYVAASQAVGIAEAAIFRNVAQKVYGKLRRKASVRR
ncbi:MAG: murein biosynthesis integral membrane protein MurJ [Desulfovibrionaceae bacterium]